MRRLKVLLATLVMALLIATPALADTVTAETGSAFAEGDSAFLGNDFGDAEVLPVDAEAESEFLFF